MNIQCLYAKIQKMTTNCVIEQLYLQLVELKEKFKHVSDYNYSRNDTSYYNNQYQFDKNLIVSGYQSLTEYQMICEASLIIL